MKYQFEKYQLQLVDNENATCNIKIFPNIGTALLKERRKLYLISTGNEILYVGEANTSIKVRFQRGSVAYNYYTRNEVARNGYRGYKWLNKIDNPKRELNVLAVVFDDSLDDNRTFVEAIEGELVYLIRQRTGKWPLFQNEIHFSNCDGALEVAEEILEKAFSGELV